MKSGPNSCAANGNQGSRQASERFKKPATCSLKRVRFHETNHPRRANFLTVFTVENNRRRAKQAEVAQQCLVIVVVFPLHQACTRMAFFSSLRTAGSEKVKASISLQLTQPVSIEVEHHGAPCGTRLGNHRL